MSRRDRVGGPTGVIRPFTPTQGHDNAQDEIAEALDHIARGIAAIDHNLQLLIARIDGGSLAVARVAASLKESPRPAVSIGSCRCLPDSSAPAPPDRNRRPRGPPSRARGNAHEKVNAPRARDHNAIGSWRS
jgi:hypothetical protein